MERATPSSVQFRLRTSRFASRWVSTWSGRQFSVAPEHLPPGQTPGDAQAHVRYLASQAHVQDIHFLWRPFLSDPNDDMVLELAFAAGSRYIVTHNINDFRGSQQLGVRAMTPRDFLAMMRQHPKP